MKKSLFLLTVLASSSVVADANNNHCTAYTPKENMTPFANEIVGKPAALGDRRLYALKNNDLFTVYTDDCGLGREGMLLLSNPFYSDEEKRQKARWILRAFYGDDNTLLDSIADIKLQGTVSILAHNKRAKHVFTFSRHAPDDYRTGLFSESITYTWIPPEEY